MFILPYFLYYCHLCLRLSSDEFLRKIQIQKLHFDFWKLIRSIFGSLVHCSNLEACVHGNCRKHFPTCRKKSLIILVEFWFYLHNQEKKRKSTTPCQSQSIEDKILLCTLTLFNHMEKNNLPCSPCFTLSNFLWWN